VADTAALPGRRDKRGAQRAWRSIRPVTTVLRHAAPNLRKKVEKQGLSAKTARLRAAAAEQAEVKRAGMPRRVRRGASVNAAVFGERSGHSSDEEEGNKNQSADVLGGGARGSSCSEGLAAALQCCCGGCGQAAKG
jgi:hypothetical protein